MKTHGIQCQLSGCRLKDSTVRRGGAQELQHNNSFNRSANSGAFIENLNLSALCARPVNSSVMSPLRVDTQLIPAAPQLNEVRLVWIMREVG